MSTKPGADLSAKNVIMFALGVLASGALAASIRALSDGATLRGGEVAAAWGGGELGRRIALVEDALPAIQARGWQRLAIVRTDGSNPMIGLLTHRLYPTEVVPIWQGQAAIERGLDAARQAGVDGIVRLSPQGQVELLDVQP
jgi:hypothetical protein